MGLIGSNHYLAAAVAIGILVSFATPDLLCAQDDTAVSEQAVAAFEEGAAAMRVGRVADAIRAYAKASDSFRAIDQPAREVASLCNLAVAYLQLGFSDRALHVLEKAREIADDLGEEGLSATTNSLMGSVATFSRRADEAEPHLVQGLQAARESGDRAAEAAGLHDLAVVYAARGMITEAERTFTECASLADSLGNKPLIAKSAVNASRMYLRAWRAASAESLQKITGGEIPEGDASAFRIKAIDKLGHALTVVGQCEESSDTAMLYLSVGEAYQQTLTDGSRGGLLKKAFEAFGSAFTMAKNLGSGSIACHALGQLGSLYEGAGRLGEALELSTRARHLAQTEAMPHALYQWEWQCGRIQVRLGREEDALATYERAQIALRAVRHDVAIGHGNRTLGESFRESVGNLYFERADLILGRTTSSDSEAEKQAAYRLVQNIVEDFKSSELEDYFQDDCVNLARSRRKGPGDIGDRTAVIYIIPLAERTEILVGNSERIDRVSSPIGRDALNQKVFRFRRLLETRGRWEFMPFAKSLYGDLIRPAEKILKQQDIHTLIFVPDGSLRLIPMAALHDGDAYLAESYAVAITPGLELEDPQAMPRSNARMLVGAVSRRVDDSPPLFHVENEVEALSDRYRGLQLLMNEAFVEQEFGAEIRDTPFRVVHIASHGKFVEDSRKSYVLAYDDEIRLDDLERMIRPRQFDSRPVELLCLSACGTAVGDDRAALGLAGVAVKSGARSSLATLWYVNDEATSHLVTGFYDRLFDAGADTSKAEALRGAQKALIADPRFEHPIYWSAFVLIGNWL